MPDWSSAIAPAEIVDMERPAYHAEAEPGHAAAQRPYAAALQSRTRRPRRTGRGARPSFRWSSAAIARCCSARWPAGGGQVRCRSSMSTGTAISAIRETTMPPPCMSAVAGMDLALATGRGDPLMTDMARRAGAAGAGRAGGADRRARGQQPRLHLGRRQRHRLQPHRRVRGARDRRRGRRRERACHRRPAGLAVLRCISTSTCSTRRSCRRSIRPAVRASIRTSCGSFSPA